MIKIFQVDSFTGEAFRGNPAAVCLLERELDERLYLEISREMNLSETAFLIPGATEGESRLRWFTPETEVRLCGHATLATAWIQYTELGMSGEIIYNTLSGRLNVSRDGERIEMNFPAENLSKFDNDLIVKRAIGCDGSSYYAPLSKKILFELAHGENLEDISPDFSSLKRLDFGLEVKGLIVTRKGSHDYDFMSRYFAPWVGINEDPVTGSAHTILGPYWSRKLGKNSLKAYQASRRGGEINLRILENDRVCIIGKAVTVLRGYLSF